MRRSVRVLILSASALFLWSCNQSGDKADAPAADDAAQPAGAQAMGPGGRPARKAGLWEHAVNTMGVTQTSTLCLDADTDKNVELWGKAVDSESGCTKNSFTPTAGGYAFESVCPDGQGGTVTSKGTITGDFASAYKMDATVTTAGSSMPQANQTMNMSMSATWKGPCPADMKPGDVKVAIAGLPGGAQLNVNDMAKMAEGMANK
jgi:hypothetical protein